MICLYLLVAQCHVLSYYGTAVEMMGTRTETFSMTVYRPFLPWTREEKRCIEAIKNEQQTISGLCQACIYFSLWKIANLGVLKKFLLKGKTVWKNFNCRSSEQLERNRRKKMKSLLQQLRSCFSFLTVWYPSLRCYVLTLLIITSVCCKYYLPQQRQWLRRREETFHKPNKLWADWGKWTGVP